MGSGTNHVRGWPFPIVVPVILIPGILFTRLSHSHPLCTGILVDFGIHGRTGTTFPIIHLNYDEARPLLVGPAWNWTSSVFYGKVRFTEWSDYIKIRRVYMDLNFILSNEISFLLFG